MDCAQKVGKKYFVLVYCTVRQEQHYFATFRAAINPRFLIKKLHVQNGDFTETACLWSKDTASYLVPLLG
jgi:hypothetical protein